MNRRGLPLSAVSAALLRVALGLASGLTLASGIAGAASAQSAQSVEELRITAPSAEQALVGRLCRPPGAGPATLVVVAHGSPPSARKRPAMAPGRCEGEAARWFLDRGYAVLFALRRGYGATGGAWAEDFGPCDRPDFIRAGLETARDLDATVAYGTSLPGIRPSGAVVVGQSAGGWGTLAYDSVAHPKVAAMVAMAPGRGGHRDGRPDSNCSPGALAAAAGRFGATASTPLLWIDGTADDYFRPAIAEALHASFAAAGGRAEFLQPVGAGHGLFSSHGGSAVWGPPVEAYLAARGVGP